MSCVLRRSRSLIDSVLTLAQPVTVMPSARWTHGMGDPGAGVGKGGGGGGSVREAGGAFGKMEAAREEEYFKRLQKKQLNSLRLQLDNEVAFHEEHIKHHQEAIERHKKRMNTLKKEEERIG